MRVVKYFSKKCSFFQSVDLSIDGWVKDNNGDIVVNLEGKWNESLRAHWLGDTEDSEKDRNEEIWRVYENNVTDDKFKLTKFASKLNDFEDEDHLPPTDSRLRLDRKFLQEGDVYRATQYKKILEERQRADKKKREEENKEWETTWFEEVSDEEGGKIWVFKGDYWDQREKKIERVKNGLEYDDLLDGGKSKDTASDFRSYPVED